MHTRIEFAERYLNICNVHGIAFPGDKLDNEDRLMQSEEIINHFKNIDTETVIGGDFNLEKQTKSVSMFEESGYRNLVNDFNIKETRNRLAWQKHPDSIQFFADYVFTTKGVSIISFKTESDEISDHLPLVLEINVN